MLSTREPAPPQDPQGRRQRLTPPGSANQRCDSKRIEIKGSATMSKIGYVGTLLREVFQFARENKVYWIVPFVLVLGLLVLLVMTSQATAPFVYTLF
jgi:hypothetical protein